MKDKPLHPGLLRHNYIEFNPTPPEPFEKIPTEKAAIGSKFLGRLLRKFFKDLCYQILGLITAVTVARSEHASKIVPGLSKKAHKGMVTLSSVFFRIITFLGPILLPTDWWPK